MSDADMNDWNQQIIAEFGIDPAGDECQPAPDPEWRRPGWGQWIEWADDRPADEDEAGFMSYRFRCPAEHLDAIYSDRFPMGS